MIAAVVFDMFEMGLRTLKEVAEEALRVNGRYSDDLLRRILKNSANMTSSGSFPLQSIKQRKGGILHELENDFGGTVSDFSGFDGTIRIHSYDFSGR